MFIAALSTIAKTRKQPTCLSTDEWIRKRWYIYPLKYCSAMKKNKLIPFAATLIQLQIIILSEVSQKETNTIWYHLCVECKIWHKWNRLTDIETRHVVAKGRGRERKDWEFGFGRCKLLRLEWMKNKVLMYSTGNYIQLPVINHNGKKYFLKNVCMCITESLCCTTEIGTTSQINCTSIKIKTKTKKHADFYKPFPGQIVLKLFFFFLPLFLSLSLILQMCWLC